ncbi:MAG: hypothetical protein FWE62_01685 [Firmicutes bacterium]|nr:hypothetical protein [Bacillota bacterium]
MTQKIYVQVGITAMREPNGERLPSVPMYVEVDSLAKTGLTDLENEAIANIAGFFAAKRKERELTRKRQKGESACVNSNL